MITCIVYMKPQGATFHTYPTTSQGMFIALARLHVHVARYLVLRLVPSCDHGFVNYTSLIACNCWQHPCS